jgi:Transglutaminase-like superfamily
MSRLLRKFLHLPAAERRLLVKAALLLGTIRLGLWLLPLHTLRRLLAKVGKAPIGLREADRYSAKRAVWAVGAAGQYLPAGVGTCLTQALAAQVLLAWRGHPALLHIGVVRKEGEEFHAHAWLESGGEVVIGGHQLERYTPLVALKGDAS